jgi:hypothetical protein
MAQMCIGSAARRTVHHAMAGAQIRAVPIDASGSCRLVGFALHHRAAGDETMLNILLALLALAAAFNGVVLLRAAIAQRLWPRTEALLLGAVVNFLDTLGIGSMAPAMASFFSFSTFAFASESSIKSIAFVSVNTISG